MEAAALTVGGATASSVATTTTPILELRAVQAALGGAPVSLALGAGERVAFIGANGVGKTTLLRIVVGLGSPAAGSVVRAAAPIAYVPQDYRASLFPWFSVRKNLALGRSARRTESIAEVDAAIAEALRVVPLPPALLARDPHRLSGGEQELVAIARVVVGAPRLLVLDEPFTALDAPTRATVIQRLDRWIAASGAGLILVSHDLDEVARLADHAVVLHTDRPPRVLALGGLGRDMAARVLFAALDGFGAG